jgi:hypothetical protein
MYLIIKFISFINWISDQWFCKKSLNITLPNYDTVKHVIVFVINVLESTTCVVSFLYTPRQGMSVLCEQTLININLSYRFQEAIHHRK